MSTDKHIFKEITKDGVCEFFGTITFTKEDMKRLCEALEAEENDN
jgi:hypothetical protein